MKPSLFPTAVKVENNWIGCCNSGKRRYGAAPEEKHGQASL